MTPQDLLLNALDDRHDDYRRRHSRCRREITETGVHDLRVATRRLLALIDLLRALDPRPRLQKLREALKAQLDELGDVRDVQVILAEIEERKGILPALGPLEEYLQGRERRLLKTAARRVRHFKVGEVSRRIANTLAAMGARGFGPGLAARLFAAMDDVFERVSRRQARVDPAAPASIHRVRVAFKRFRYMVEIIHPILPGYPGTHFDAMHEYQASMGHIGDVGLLLSALEEFAADHGAYDPQPMISLYERRQAELIAAYVGNMHQLAAFWRSGPESSFPWEVGGGY
ncbi:MAG TPA: CHAD domain-containing protein [Verrucomicrobiae bacterium]|nr:CHAD domain-containing protein [Verrucomicrobiae bacterium]